MVSGSERRKTTIHYFGGGAGQKNKNTHTQQMILEICEIIFLYHISHRPHAPSTASLLLSEQQVATERGVVKSIVIDFGFLPLTHRHNISRLQEQRGSI